MYCVHQGCGSGLGLPGSEPELREETQIRVLPNFSPSYDILDNIIDIIIVYYYHFGYYQIEP